MLTARERLEAEHAEAMKSPDWGRDPRVSEELDAKYKQLYGSGKVKTSDGIEINHGARLGKPEGTPAKPPEGIDPRLKALMLPVWGANTEHNLLKTQNIAALLFGNQPELFEEATKAIGNDSLTLRLLHQIEQTLKRS